MKQNSSILFHLMRKTLIFRYFHTVVFGLVGIWMALIVSVSGAEKPEYLKSFDPAKGFKPAQRDLTEVFLQMAGSLEAYGSPEPYFRHVVKEHERIEALYREKYGKAPRSFRPGYMTDEYITGLCGNWSLLSPNLGLEPYAKEVGNRMRDAINGTRGTGTIIIDIFNRHQTKVFDAIQKKDAEGADFEALRSELVTQLELNKKSVDEERYEVAHRDAVSFALAIQGITFKLFKRLDQGLNPADAEKIKTFITSVIMDTGEMANSELEAGISEWAFGKISAAAK